MMKKKQAAAPCPEVHCLCMGMGPKLSEMLECKSEAAAGHLRNARVEFLKGMRALIDARIEQIGKEQKKKGTAVPVE